MTRRCCQARVSAHPPLGLAAFTIGAFDIARTLSADDLAAIEGAVPPGSARGDRYPSALMSSLGTGN